MAGCSYRGGAAQNHCRLRRVRTSFADLIIAFLDDHFENPLPQPYANLFGRRCSVT